MTFHVCQRLRLVSKNCLNKLHVYCKKMVSQNKHEKTQYLLISRNGKQPKCKLHFVDNIVKQTNEYCYLGVMNDNSMWFIFIRHENVI